MSAHPTTDRIALWNALESGVTGLICSVTSDCRVEYANAAWAQFCGVGIETLLSDGFQTVIHPDDLPPFERAIVTALQSGEACRTTFRLCGRDAIYHWFEASLVPVNGERGESRCIGTANRIDHWKQVEDALHECEINYRFTIDLNPQIPWIAGPDGDMRSFNQRGLELTGRTRQEVVGGGWRSVVPADDLPDVERAWNHAVETGRQFDVEHRICLADGTLRWMRSRALPRRDDSGKIILWYGTTEDIHDRTVTEEALRDSEQRFRDLADNIAQLAWMADGTGYIFWYNRRWYEYTGTTLAEMEGWDWRKVHHPDEVENVVRRFREHIQAGTEWEDTFPLRGADGRYRWFLSRAVPIRDASGAVVRWFGTNTDVTELRETTQALEESEQKFRAMFQKAAVGIALVSTRGRWLQVNERLCEIVGYSQEQMMRLTFQDITHPDDLESDMEYVRQMLAGQRDSYGMEKRYIRSDGSLVWVQLTVSLVRDGDKQPFYFISVIRDITDRRLAEEEVRQMAATLERRVEERTRQLQEANEELEAFGYSISHDLRAPLRAMQGFSDALREDYGERLDGIARDYIERISDAAVMMDTLINDLLSYSRISRAEIELRPVDLHAIVTDASQQIVADLQESGARVEVERSLPDALGHRGILVQIITNLLSNAIKFRRKGVQPHVRVYHTIDDAAPGYMRLWFEDNGIGIEPKHQERIFRVFERLHGIEEYPGTGIGLAIVKKGMERMGGRAGVVSEPGQGSRFWIELKRAAIGEERK